MTDYLLLEKDKMGERWVEIPTRVQAVSAKAAIREFLDGLGTKTSGEYVAVPARSWQPVKVQVETALKFS